jgi:hypothetical protein
MGFHNPASTRTLFRTLGAALILCVTELTGAAQELPGPRAIAIQSVDAAPVPGADASTVTVHANGPLPLPRVGVLDAPPRIYLDFTGVRLPSGVTAEWQDSRLRGVRLAQYSVDPLVARVVIDLREPVIHRIDSSERGGGKIVLRLGEQKPAAAPGPDPPVRSQEAARYLAQVTPTLVRLHALRHVLGAIDGRVVVEGADFSATAVELDALGRTLAAMAVPAPLTTTHDVMVRACALAARAARMRQESSTSADPAAARNAASAAAGALILLDRATRDLGYVPPGP